jgi:peroxiredoxin
MTDQPTSPIEAAYLKVRSSDLSLRDRLKVVADAARAHKPWYAEAVDDFAGRLAQVHAGADAPAVGEQMPDFLLPDHEGQLVSLADILARGPAVVAFHRGHWCPFCRLSMTSLAEIEQRVKPAQIVAISTETQRYTRMLREQTGAMFPVLTDMDAAYTMSLNLAVWVDTKLAGMISEAGWDIPLYQGGTDWVLPIPSVFVVRQDGTIAARHIDPDYRQRMEIDELLSCVQGLG